MCERNKGEWKNEMSEHRLLVINSSSHRVLVSIDVHSISSCFERFSENPSKIYDFFYGANKF